MHFRVLGPLEVAEAGTLLDLGGPKQRALLTCLLISANRVVSVDRLVELLWGDESPARATHSLQVYVSNLRAVLEPNRPVRSAAQVLVTVAPGYVLRVADADYDAACFTAMASEGRRWLAEKRPTAALARLRDSLALWRGGALCEFSHEPFAVSEAARLEELRWVAIEDRLAAELALGGHAEVAAETEALLAQSTWRERLWGHYLLALYRTGRQAEALRAYQRARQTLIEEMGIELGPALQTLEAAILTQDPALDFVGPPPDEPSPFSDLVVSHRPPRLPPDPSRQLVGRQPEMFILDAALSSARSGAGSVVQISGEAGIGKSRLVEEAADRARLAGMKVAWGRGAEGEGAPPHWPWVQVIRSVLMDYPPEVVVAAIRDGAPDLAQIVPEVKELVGPIEAAVALDPAAARFRLYEAATAFLSRLSAHCPLVVILEDLQWNDVPSTFLLSHLCARVEPTCLVVAVTYRQPDTGDSVALGELLGTLARLRHLARIELGGWSVGDVGRFIAQTTGTEPSPAQMSAIYDRTEGNPFFVAELSRLLVAEGPPPDGTAVPITVPAGVRDVLARRLARLPEATVALLSVGAVIGRNFDLEITATAARVDLDDALDLVEAAVAAGIVNEQPAAAGTYRFSHALVRDALYSQLAGLRRARLHAKVGDAVERRWGDQRQLMVLAHHYFLGAAAVGPNRGIAFGMRAAADAQVALAYEAAQENLRRVIDLTNQMPEGPERVLAEIAAQNRLRLLLTATKGFTSREVGDVVRRIAHLTEEGGDPLGALGARYGEYAMAMVRGEVGRGIDLAEQLLSEGEKSNDRPMILAGHFAMSMASMWHGEPRTAHLHGGQAIALSDELAHLALSDVFVSDPRVSSRSMQALSASLLGDQSAAEELTLAAIRLAEDVEHAHSLVSALTSSAWLGAIQRDAIAVRDKAERGVEVATTNGFEEYVELNNILLGWAAARLGEPSTGLETINRACRFMLGRGWTSVPPMYAGLRAEAEWLCGLGFQALETIEAALESAEAGGERIWEVELRRLRGEILSEIDPTNLREAISLLRDGIEVAQRQGAVIFERRAEDILHRLV